MREGLPREFRSPVAKEPEAQGQKGQRPRGKRARGPGAIEKDINIRKLLLVYFKSPRDLEALGVVRPRANLPQPHLGTPE